MLARPAFSLLGRVMDAAGLGFEPRLAGVEPAAPKITGLDLARRYARRILEGEEGCVLHPYRCPAGYWTIGYGHMISPQRAGPTHPAITHAEAEALLDADLARYFTAALAGCPVLAREHPQRLAAVTSFVFNVGIAAFNASTLRRKINAREWAEAEAQFGRWVRAGAVTLPVLVARRRREAAYFSLRKAV